MTRLDRNQVEQHELEFVAGKQPAASATPAAAERPTMAAAAARPAMTGAMAPATKSTTATGSTPATLHERKITMIAMMSKEMHIYS
jgi:hypothetical protein